MKQIFGPGGFGPEAGWKWWSSLLAAVLIYVLATFLSIVIVAVPMLASVSEADIAAGLLPRPETTFVLAAGIASQILIIFGLMWAGGRKASGWREGLRIVPVRAPGRWVTALVLMSLTMVAVSVIFDRAYPDALHADGLWVEELLLQPDTWFATLIMITVGAAVSEEMLFRGFLLPAFARTRLGFSGAAIVTSLLWALIHAYSWQGTLLIMLTGLVFSYALWRTGSILPGIAMHALLNGGYAAMAIATA